MLEYIIFSLGVIGCTFIVTQSYIFEGVRSFVESKNKHLGKLINCPMCFGFWTGLFFYMTYDIEFFYVILVACGTSFLCYFSYLSLRDKMDKFD